jgi:hypothetical protein
MCFMKSMTRLLVDELERIDERAPAGLGVALRNESCREFTRRLQRAEPKAASSVPADRLRRRLR